MYSSHRLQRSSRALSLAVLLVSAPLSACYESAAPIADTSSTPFDVRLPGQWRCVAEDAPDTSLLSISVVSPTQYDLVMGAADEQPSRYHAHSARLNGVPLANVQQLDEDGTPGKWVLARYTLLRPAVLQLEIASDHALEGPDEGGAPRARALQRLKKGDLFDQFCVCVRVLKAKEAGVSAPATSAAPAPLP